MVEYFPDALFDVDFATLAVTNLNRTARRMLGYSLEDLKPPVSLNVGHLMDTDALLRAEKMIRALIRESLDTGAPYERQASVEVSEVSVRRKDGTRFDAEFYGMMLLDEHGRPFVGRGVLHDLTQRKQAEREREQLLVQLQQAIESVNALSGLLPVCAWCRRINHDGTWKPLEQYIQSHGGNLSHGICPQCEREVMSRPAQQH
jgi:PAS domain S-box-containing protein